MKFDAKYMKIPTALLFDSVGIVKYKQSSDLNNYTNICLCYRGKHLGFSSFVEIDG